MAEETKVVSETPQPTERKKPGPKPKVKVEATQEQVLADQEQTPVATKPVDDDVKAEEVVTEVKVEPTQEEDSAECIEQEGHFEGFKDDELLVANRGRKFLVTRHGKLVTTVDRIKIVSQPERGTYIVKAFVAGGYIIGAISESCILEALNNK